MLTHLARARGASPHICRKKGAHKLSQNHRICDVFAASEKTKIEYKDSEKTRNTVFFDVFDLSALSGAKTHVQESA